MKVVITGANGFIGSRLLGAMIDNYECVAIGRQKPDLLVESDFFHAQLDADADYSAALINADVVVHCAARAHIMNDESLNPIDEYRAVNTHGTLNLAEQAARSDVKRFIFISSIKVNGELTDPDNPFVPELKVPPQDPYGLSKYEAEIGLKSIADTTSMEVVIIRPPLVYGEGVKANFAFLLKLASLGIPLPFGAITQNRRSLVSVDNLVDLIITCLDHPNAANQTFLVSDNDDLSTADMINRLSRVCGRSGRAIPVPEWLLNGLFNLLGKSEMYQRLCGSLQVDISGTIERLDWKPPYKVDECFARTAKHYLDNR